MQKITLLRFLISSVFFFSFALLGFSQNFVTRWNLATAGSGATLLQFNTEVTGASAVYTWEEVSPGNATGSGAISVGDGLFTISGLPSGSIVRVSITPTNLKRFYMGTTVADRNRLEDVEEWGTANWTSMYATFQGCANLAALSAIDAPNLSSVTNMGAMFNEATSFNDDLNTWNTANVSSIASIFESATAFNGNISNWNTGNVIDMSHAFRSTDFFNGNISAWNTTKVEDMSFMFLGATAFNQPLNWNTEMVMSMLAMFGGATAFNGDISAWDTRNVETMSNMFRFASNFNADISAWNTAKVTDMTNMFLNATTFNRPLNWTLTDITTMASMLNNSGMDCSNYSTTLANWNTNNPTLMNITLGAIGRTYSSAGETARNSLISRGWTISGDAACLALPIEWVDFKVTKQANDNLLTWNIVEEDNDFFQIERSENGTNFYDIATLKSQGNGSNEYRFTDNSANNNPITYYRIKAVERNGETSYSKIVATNNLSEKEISIYPNPATTELFLNGLAEKTDYRIYNTVGSLLQQGTLEGNKNASIYKALPKEFTA